MLALRTPLPANNLEHALCIGSLFQGLAKFGFVQQLGNIGEGMQMLLELALWHQKEHDQVDGLIIQRIEADSFF